jgi:hypothetical protein
MPPSSNSKTSPSSPTKEYYLYIPEIEEIRISPIISRKGYLHVCDDRRGVWRKRWIVVRRPHVFLFRDEKDPVERNVVNLANSQVIYDPDADGPQATIFTYAENMILLHKRNTIIVLHELKYASACIKSTEL